MAFLKHLSLLLLLFLPAAALRAQSKIVANVTSFENNKGVCFACLFSNADDFKKMKALQCVSSSVVNKSSVAVFSNLPQGTYALFVFHDTNNNGQMDTNFLGIPKEGYGASQNKLPFAAAPKFDANKFSLLGNSTVSLNIKLRNI